MLRTKTNVQQNHQKQQLFSWYLLVHIDIIVKTCCEKVLVQQKIFIRKLKEN